jgi:DMSO/TMAO reductase YedYZ molybdopterin-dependent catalytic subunit
VFRGADQGNVGDAADPIHFERSLPVTDADYPGSLLAYAMNGEPLPREHGYPLRLIVPGWYAVASVKWLTEIEAIGSPFTGFFQTKRYVYESQRNGALVLEPVRLQHVRAVITQPSAGQQVTVGDLVVRGVTWSGAAPIEKVEVSIGGGPWQNARLIGQRHRHSWQWWELLTRIDSPGETTLRARATDLAGGTQPERPRWNRLGYGGNAVHNVLLLVR